MMTVATYSDVAVAIGRDISSPAEQEQVEWWLTGLELIIKARLGDLSLLDQDVLLYVEVEAAAAMVRRHGTRESSITVSTDDSSVTRRFDSAADAADITDAWWALLDPKDALGAFTIRTPFRLHRSPGVFW